MDQKQPVKPPKCTFSGVVPIELKRFLDSDIGLVECPNCACTRTLKPQGGVLQFKSHDKRKTSTPNTGPRWAKVETGGRWETFPLPSLKGLRTSFLTPAQNQE